MVEKNNLEQEQAFALLDADTQRKILGKAKWLAWKDGAFDFSDLSVKTYSPVWGAGRKKASLVELLGEDGRDKYRELAKDLFMGREKAPWFRASKLADLNGLFSLNNFAEEVLFNNVLDLREEYGNELLFSRETIFSTQQKTHVYQSHHRDINWLQTHQADVLRAIRFPTYVENSIPYNKRDGYKVARVIDIVPGEWYLNVVLNYYGEQSGIFTMFLANYRYIFESDGTLKKRWRIK